MVFFRFLATSAQAHPYLCQLVQTRTKGGQMCNDPVCAIQGMVNGASKLTRVLKDGGVLTPNQIFMIRVSFLSAARDLEQLARGIHVTEGIELTESKK